MNNIIQKHPRLFEITPEFKRVVTHDMSGKRGAGAFKDIVVIVSEGFLASMDSGPMDSGSPRRWSAIFCALTLCMNNFKSRTRLHTRSGADAELVIGHDGRETILLNGDTGEAGEDKTSVMVMTHAEWKLFYGESV